MRDSLVTDDDGTIYTIRDNGTTGGAAAFTILGKDKDGELVIGGFSAKRKNGVVDPSSFVCGDPSGEPTEIVKRIGRRFLGLKTA
jgi:hypothetical protein